MYTYAHMCAYVYNVHMHIYMYTYTYTDIYVCMHACMHVCMYLCMYVFLYVGHTRVCVFIYVAIHTCQSVESLAYSSRSFSGGPRFGNVGATASWGAVLFQASRVHGILREIGDSPVFRSLLFKDPYVLCALGKPPSWTPLP